jgi:hypothetical protein
MLAVIGVLGRLCEADADDLCRSDSRPNLSVEEISKDRDWLWRRKCR